MIFFVLDKIAAIKQESVSMLPHIHPIKSIYQGISKFYFDSSNIGYYHDTVGMSSHPPKYRSPEPYTITASQTSVLGINLTIINLQLRLLANLKHYAEVIFYKIVRQN